jgi:hypothetical protein
MVRGTVTVIFRSIFRTSEFLSLVASPFFNRTSYYTTPHEFSTRDCFDGAINEYAELLKATILTKYLIKMAAEVLNNCQPTHHSPTYAAFQTSFSQNEIAFSQISDRLVVLSLGYNPSYFSPTTSCLKILQIATSSVSLVSSQIQDDGFWR